MPSGCKRSHQQRLTATHHVVIELCKTLGANLIELRLHKHQRNIPPEEKHKRINLQIKCINWRRCKPSPRNPRVLILSKDCWTTSSSRFLRRKDCWTTSSIRFLASNDCWLCSRSWTFLLSADCWTAAAVLKVVLSKTASMLYMTTTKSQPLLQQQQKISQPRH